MTPTERLYPYLCGMVALAGVTLMLDRVDAWLAGFEPKAKPVRDRYGIPEDDD